MRCKYFYLKNNIKKKGKGMTYTTMGFNDRKNVSKKSQDSVPLMWRMIELLDNLERCEDEVGQKSSATNLKYS